MGTASRVVGAGLVVLLAGSLAVPGLAQTAPATDNTVTRVEVHSDGSARWTVRIRTRLSTDAEVAAYRAFQERFRNDTGRYLAPFRDRIRAVVANAANATGREMRAVNFTAATSIQRVPRRWGVVSYSFTWTGFAARNDGRLVVGDVFQGGLIITENDTLVVEAPPGYRVAAVDPAPSRRDGGTLTWIGRVDFADARPRAVFVPDRDTPATLSPSKASPPGPGADSGDGTSSRWTLAVAGVAVVLALAAGAVAVLRVRDGTSPVAPAGRESGTGDSPGAAGDAGSQAAADERLLSDGERVLNLLGDEGGRMKQQEVAERLGWSDSKTSRVVSRLTEDGDAEKVRIGRENVVSLPEDRGE